MAEKLTRKDFADGTMLRELIKMFQKSQTQISLAGLLSCLRDSEVVVPVKLKDEGATTLPDGKTERTFIPCNVVADDGERYIPVFSNTEQVDESIKKGYTLAEMDFMQCMIMAERMRNVKGIIVDGYTNKFVLKNELFGYVRKMPSRISK